MKIILDGKKIDSVDTFHNEIEKISSIDGYGRNLDALFDALTEMRDISVEIKNPDALREHLGNYADSIIAVFEDAAEDNEFLTVEFE
ncbi:MAG: barstar family protein [Oscillospiraceae bacterium]|nr:barstar family protein [Oscillospiraceae bacterium]